MSTLTPFAIGLVLGATLILLLAAALGGDQPTRSHPRTGEGPTVRAIAARLEQERRAHRQIAERHNGPPLPKQAKNCVSQLL
ncbi:hypothetical protein [Nocardia sp. NBC_00511]|uniref:hypothetical protein n=1 Tax=Nocardia sp. NBC_00511 TaxID=2903591 RepID=UPI0030DEF623